MDARSFLDVIHTSEDLVEHTGMAVISISSVLVLVVNEIRKALSACKDSGEQHRGGKP
jgi:hypothetical protein